MADVQLYLYEADKDRAEATRLAGETAKKLESKQLKLVDLIQSLGEYLNNEEAALRIKTLAYLAEVLAALPTKVLSRQQRDLLTDFVLSRFQNGAEGLAYCARALGALERLGAFPEERIGQIMDSLFQNSSPLVQVVKTQSDRQAVLVLVDTLMAKYRSVLRKIHEEDEQFMPQLIALFDGERDPRNLMIVFSVLQVAMVEWDISGQAQNLFEAVFNYFPITFRPPPGDPFGITAQDLKDRLRDCIASSGYLAPYAFPALLDKLDSTSMNTKRDSLQTITACINRYGSETVHLYSITLWDSLKFEILNVQEEDLAEEALQALQAIATQLSSSTHHGPLQTYLKPVIKECNEHLEDTPTKQSAAAGRMLNAISKASLEASDMLGKGCLPQLFVLMKTSDNLPRRRGFMEILKQLLESYLVTYGPWRKSVPSDSTTTPVTQPILRATGNTFSEFRTESIAALTSALIASPKAEVSFRLLALDGLRSLVMIRGLLDDLEIAKVIKVIDDIVINEEQYGKDEVKAAAMDSLVQIAHQKPQLVIESSIPEFMARLPDTDADFNEPYVPILEAIAKLSAEHQIFRTIMIRLKNKLYAAVRQGASSKYIAGILSAILYAFSSGSSGLSDPAVFGNYYQDFVIPLLNDFITPQGQLAQIPAIRETVALELIGRICNTIMRSQVWVSQTEICRNVYSLFRQVDIHQLPPFTTQDAHTMIVSTHLLASLHKEATPHTDMFELLSALVSFTTSSSQEPAVVSAAISQISLLVSKYFKPATTKDIIQAFFAGSDSLLLSNKLNPTTLRISFATLKAVVLRTDPELPTLLAQFFNLFSDPTYGTSAARAFSALLAPDDLLTKANHCTIYALHKQRLFALSISTLAGTFKDTKTSKEGKDNILIALSGVLYWIPYDLLKSELPTLIPLLLQSLRLEDADVKARTIAIFEKIVLEDHKLVEEHVSSMINRLLEIAVGATKVNGAKSASTSAAMHTPPKARAGSLACLTAFVTSFRTELLLPQKQIVIRGLMPALDDPKRAVRAEAVRCRKAWSGLGGTSADEDE